MKRPRSSSSSATSSTARSSSSSSSSAENDESASPSCWLSTSVFFNYNEVSDDDDEEVMSPRGMPRQQFLQRSLSIRELEDNTWLSSSFLDLALSKIAARHHGVHFLSCDFAVLSAGKNSTPVIRDIRGHTVDYAEFSKPLCFFICPNSIHWNLVRVLRDQAAPCLELYEPMGTPASRHSRGLNFRSVPQAVVSWLDKCSPLVGAGKKKESWLSKSTSVIVTPQQLNGVDCGVASLLYAEKCGQGFSADAINRSTTQVTITQYRVLLKAFLHNIN